MLDLLALLPKTQQNETKQLKFRSDSDTVINRVIEFMEAQPKSNIDEIIAAVQKPRHIVSRGLRLLESYGMVKFDNDECLFVSRERTVVDAGARRKKNKELILGILENRVAIEDAVTAIIIANKTNLSYDVVKKELHDLKDGKLVSLHIKSAKQHLWTAYIDPTITRD